MGYVPEGFGGMACRLLSLPATPPGTRPLYLLRDANDGCLLTTNPVEVTAARGSGFVLRGVAGIVFDATVQAPGTRPLYALFNPGTGEHFYVTNPEELDLAKRMGFVPQEWQGISCNVYDAADPRPDTTPLYRFLKPGSGAGHYFATEEQDRVHAGSMGYAPEGFGGIACKLLALPATPSGTRPLYLLRNANEACLLTTNPDEVTSAAGSGYVLRGVAGIVFDATVQAPGTRPLYALFNPGTGEHFYVLQGSELWCTLVTGAERQMSLRATVTTPTTGSIGSRI